MNNYVPDWNYETDLPVTGQKNPTGADHDLVELLWRNGQVVLNSQTQRKQGTNIPSEPPRQALQHNKLHDHDNHHHHHHRNGPINMAQDDHETVSWIHHYPIEDSFDNKEFCSNFFSELLSCDPIAAKQSEAAAVGRECSLMAVELSHCGSDQLNTAGPAQPAPLWAGPSGKEEALEPTATSSSGGSGSSFGRAFKQCPTTTTSGNTANNKRKNREPEELECQSKAAELEYAAVNGSAPRAGTSRKSRAAEVHNLSERRRRDRINEKMKALQELIPHSNKTDKASMLDEAIEYLKSLQLQLQVMWMGSGMAPVMLPGSQHYMAVGPPAGMLSPIASLPRVPESMIAAPSTDHQIMCQTQATFNLLNYANHPMQSASLHEQYARLMGFHPIQTVTQPMNVFRFNPRTVQQQRGQSIAQQGINNGPSSGGALIDGGLRGKNTG